MNGELAGWTPRPAPGFEPMEGRHVRVEPIRDASRFGELFEAFSADAEGALWRWMSYGPFAGREDFFRFAEKTYLSPDMVFHAVVPKGEGKALGVAALMRIDRANGVIEIGNICFAPALQGTLAASEAHFLLMRRVFDELGYRRYEWKCNDGNAPSKRAALRLGFAFEGLFRQHMVVKGANRDTAWYSIIDREWQALKAAFEVWLHPGNFDAGGRQRRRLAEIRQASGG